MLITTGQELSHEQQFFMHFFYSQQSQAVPLSQMQPFHHLKQKFKICKQASYNTPRAVLDINYLRKFQDICSYMPFVSNFQAYKIDITTILDAFEQVYNDYEHYFVDGGWKIVKNKSLTCHLQQYLLLKLAKNYTLCRMFGSLDKYVICFFFTVNYFKSCNYEIRLFCQFLKDNFEFDLLFLFIMLRKKSKRMNRDMTISAQYVQNFVNILKSDNHRSAKQISYTSMESQNGQLDAKQIKLLLLYSGIVEYIQNQGIVLTEIMIYNLMECSGVVNKQESILQYGRINWKQFLEFYFDQICKISDKSYKNILLTSIIQKNIQLAECLFPQEESSIHYNTFNEQSEPSQIIGEMNQKQKYLQQSFTYIIGMLEKLFYRRFEAPPNLQLLYNQFNIIYDHDVIIVNKMVKEILKSQGLYVVYQKYCRKDE